jgi:hypothetical protein
MTETEQHFNLIEMTKEGTQLRTVAVIFENNSTQLLASALPR